MLQILLALGIAMPERGAGDARDITAHDDFNRQGRSRRTTLTLGSGDSSKWCGVSDTASNQKAESWFNTLAFVGYKSQDTVKSRQPVGDDQDQKVVYAEDLAHLAAGDGDPGRAGRWRLAA